MVNGIVSDPRVFCISKFPARVVLKAVMSHSLLAPEVNLIAALVALVISKSLNTAFAQENSPALLRLACSMPWTYKASLTEFEKSAVEMIAIPAHLRSLAGIGFKFEYVLNRIPQPEPMLFCVNPSSLLMKIGHVTSVLEPPVFLLTVN
jgi:hypothetical protein